MQEVVKKKGNVVSFDIAKQVEAMKKCLLQDYRDDLKKYIKEKEEHLQKLDYEALLLQLAQFKYMCRLKNRQISEKVRALWMKRNDGAGRSNTSSVSDRMLLTIPTPPTAVAAISSLGCGGVLCETYA